MVSPISLPLPPTTETTVSGATVAPVEHDSGGLGPRLSDGDRLGTSLGLIDMDGLKLGKLDGNKLADGLKLGILDGNKLAEG